MQFSSEILYIERSHSLNVGIIKQQQNIEKYITEKRNFRSTVLLFIND